MIAEGFPMMPGLMSLDFGSERASYDPFELESLDEATLQLDSNVSELTFKT